MGRFTRLSTPLLTAFLALACGDNKKTDEDATDVTEEDATDVTEEVPCTSDGDCDNGLYCDGLETCGTDGTCQPGTEVDCDDSDPCTSDECDNDISDCVYELLDEDGDGVGAAEAPTGETCDGTDCDDTRDDWYPGAPEDECDFLSKDCDEDIWEHIDDDQDGWIDEACDGILTDPGDFTGLGDCNDEADDIYPGATEVCDMIDQDCDGSWADGGADDDGDTYLDETCGGDDCNDDNADAYPGATEICDLVDNDCDGSIMDAAGIDDDGDLVPDQACGGNDCNDGDATIFGTFDPPTGTTDPAVTDPATEECDTVDDDCDGSWADGGADDDGDTYLDETCGGPDCNDSDRDIYTGAPRACDADHDCDTIYDNDSDEDGFVWDACSTGTDCNDSDAGIHPGAAVTCTTVDRDCNGNPDNDQDGDGHVRELVQGTWPACSGDDCDDDDAAVYLGATEICDNVDNDCDGSFLDASGADDDGDTYLDIACGGPDCDDTTVRYSPAADPDVCTRDDYNCDSILDDLGPLTSSRIDDAGSASAWRARLAWSGSEFGVVWSDDRVSSGSDEVYFRRIDPSGIPVAPSVNVSQQANSSEVPDIAWAGSRWGIVWEDDTTAAVYFATLAADGSDRQPGSGPTQIPTTGCSSGIIEPRIASSGSQFGIAWECYDASGNSLVGYDTGSTAGTLTLSSPVIIVDNGLTMNWDPDIAWNTSGFGIVWRAREASGNPDNLYFDIVNPASGGHLTDVDITGLPTTRDAESLAIAGGSVDVGGHTDGFGVVWTRRQSSLHIVFGQVVSLSDPPVASTAVQLSADTVEYTPSVFWSGNSYGVVWVHRGAALDYDVIFTQMATNGTETGDGEVVATDTLGVMNPDLAWGPGMFSAVWHEDNDQVWYTPMLCTY